MPRADSSLAPSLAELAALGKLWKEHAPKLLAMVRRRIDPALGARLDAEGILSEAFLRARNRWKAFTEQAVMTPYAWLYRIALDCLIEAYRRETGPRHGGRNLMPLPDGTSVQLGLGLMHTGTSPSNAAAREELRRQMKQVLDQLKEEDREILWMRHADELSYKEAAAILGISENAATQRYRRALARLSDLWLQLHPDWSP
jgi:RNA polymerase sigma-70 factor (ECF subfamily)